MDTTQYVNGSDLLISFGGDATGHATSHTLSFSTETKDMAIKPAASATQSNASLFKKKRVTGLAVQIKAEGIAVYSEGEAGVSDFLSKWKVGKPVEVEGFHRGNDSNPYVSGDFIISALEIGEPAGEDTTYNITLDNDGPVDIDETKFSPAPQQGGGNVEEH